MTKERLRGHFLILAVNIIFGINTPVSKYLLTGHMSPEALTFMRMAGGCLLFWVASLFFPKEKIDKWDYFKLFLCGMSGVVFNQGAYIFALSITSPVDASVMVTSTPIFVMVLSFYILREPITRLKAGGVFLGAAGAVWLILSNTRGMAEPAGESRWLGDLIVLFTSLVYSAYFVLSKPLVMKYSALTIMKWMFLFSALTTSPFLVDDVVASGLFDGTWVLKDVMSVFYVVFMATFITYLLIPIALKPMRPTTVSMYNYVQPVVTTLLAVFYYAQDSLSVVKVLAGVMIFAGVYMVTKSKRTDSV